jgi:hypothetical protein
MIRSTALISLAAAAFTLGVSAPALAQAPTYRVVPVAKIATNDSVIVGETLWNCGAAGCTTAKSTSRPAVVCEQTAKKFGKIESFTVGTTAFDEAALAKCNAKAKA